MDLTHHWCFYLSPEAAWEAMYQDCAMATESIEFEQYILQNDAEGNRFLRLFIDKATVGVNVFVICDRYGSASLHDSALVWKLREKGGRVHFYHALGYWDIFRPWRWFPRTHVKTLLVDSRIAYTGGVCIASQMKDWRDTQIRIRGPVVSQVKRAFEHTRDILSKKKRETFIPKEACQDFIYLQSNPALSGFVIYTELMRAISQAKRYIYITTPFFVPSRRFKKMLGKAVARGVEVILLIPMRSDVLIADWVFLSYANRLLTRGLKIYRYKETNVHSKTVVIDDEWATIGSTNMDVLSFFYNRESNLIIKNKNAISELKGHFLADLEKSEELTKDELAIEPYYKLLIGRFARLLKHFLK